MFKTSYLEMQLMNKKWSIRDYDEGDEININPLLNLVYKINRGLTYWIWEFKNNPGGFKTLLATDGSSIIGHLSALKREIKIGDMETIASMEVEGVTHPKYQKKGIFVALGRKLLSDLEKEGVALVYGFPNENAIYGHRKLHCIELFTLHIMIRPLNIKKISKMRFSGKIPSSFANLAGKLTFGLLYRPKKPNIDEEVEIKIITEFDNRFDDFWNNVKTGQNIIFKRNSKYLNWRYTQCPEKHYKIYVAERNNEVLAWVVVRIIKRFGYNNGAIVDLLGQPNHVDTLHALILQAVDDFKQKDVDLVACSVPKSSNYYRILKKCGFATCPNSLNPKKEAFIIYPLSGKLNMDLVKNAANWYITWGDTDVV
jgi:hypothetical protein